MEQDAIIQEFDGNCKDAEGDFMVGWYYQLVDADEEPIMDFMGPYNTNTEAEHACQRAFDTRECG